MGKLLADAGAGVYMRPKFNHYAGRNLRPSPTSVMQVITKSNGETIQIHGSEAARRLGLSTQRSR
ncbi:DUF6088 family protein [Pseudomonas sp. OTU5201]|uniref:DUF6088 family protein n=1 Tax=Pseudomonas sp. OTU5201 TaxID=3043850 RepID=UPI00406D09F0